MIQTKEKTIDGKLIAVTQFPARHGFKIKARLAKLLGPALASAAAAVQGGNKGSLLEADVDIAALGAAVSTLVASLDSDSTLDLVMGMLTSTRMDGKEVTDSVFDMEFAGNYATLYKVLAFVVEVNYGDFFGKGGIGNLVDKVSPKPTKK